MTSNGVPWSIAPAVESVGMGFRAQYPDHVVMSVGRLRETRGELHGEMTAEHEGSQLYRGSMNLSGMTSRTSAAKYLTGRTNGANLPWPGILEHFCVGVLERSHAGEPFEDAGGAEYVRRPALPRPLPILREGMPVQLFAAGGTGKSHFAAGCAVSMASGLPLMPGWAPSHAVNVLILDYEADRQTWEDMFSGIAEGMGIATPRFVYHKPRRTIADECEAISSAVTSRGIGFIVVDAMMAAVGSGGERDPSDGPLRFFAALSLFRCTSLLLDHVTGNDLGADAKEPTKSYGSVVKGNSVRAAYSLRGEPEQTDPSVVELMLSHTKDNYGPKEPRRGIRIRHMEGRAVKFEECPIESPGLVSKLSAPEQIARLLKAGCRTQKEIADELDLSYGTVKVTISRDDGKRFRKLSDGRIGLGYVG